MKSIALTLNASAPWRAASACPRAVLPNATCIDIYALHIRHFLMMREVKPLSDRQWAMVIEQLREGPTPEMVHTLKMARERAKDIREISHEEVERRRRRAAAES